MKREYADGATDIEEICAHIYARKQTTVLLHETMMKTKTTTMICRMLTRMLALTLKIDVITSRLSRPKQRVIFRTNITICAISTSSGQKYWKRQYIRTHSLACERCWRFRMTPTMSTRRHPYTMRMGPGSFTLLPRASDERRNTKRTRRRKLRSKERRIWSSTVSLRRCVATTNWIRGLSTHI